LFARARPYCPLGTIGTVTRVYGTFKANEGMEGRKIANKYMKKIGKCNTKHYRRLDF
jgi:hypothetical protein